MGKRKITNEGNLESMILPKGTDMLGMAVKMLGADRIMVKCQDGKDRLCQESGKANEKSLDPRWGHRLGFSMGFSEGRAWRHLLALQKNPV